MEASHAPDGQPVNAGGDAGLGDAPAAQMQRLRRAYGSTPYFDDVRQFHQKFGLPTKVAPVHPGHEPGSLVSVQMHPIDTDVVAFRLGFIVEELREAIVAVQDGDLITLADSLVDTIYVVHGTGLFAGIDLEEVHRVTVTPRLGYPMPVPTRSMERYLVARQQPVPGPVFARYVETGFFSEEPVLVGRERYALVTLTEAVANAGTAGTALCRQNALEAAAALLGIEQLCLATAYALRLPFDHLWDDVQAANLRKVRAPSREASREGSGRGHAADVIKPEGWQGPRTEEILSAWDAM